MYKILTGQENTDRSKFFSSYNLQGHDYKLYKFRSCLNVRKFFFSSQHIADVWNSLPYNVVNVESVNNFNSRLDKCKEWSI